jgi:hypothetical protein
VAAVQTIQNGEHVIYIDFEDDERGVVGRLRALGAHTEAISGWFTYIRPDEPLYNRDVATRGLIDFNDTIDRKWPLRLAIIDGVTEAMTLEGYDLMSNADIAAWIKIMPRKLADAGAAVTAIDHVTKSRDGRGKFALGGQHKLSGIDGAAYGFECTRPLARALSDPITGKATLTVRKDRPGYVRARAQDSVVGTLELTAYPDGGVSATILAPNKMTSAPDSKLRADILALVKMYEGAAKSQIETTLGGNAAMIRGATAYLVANGQIEVRKEGVAHRHYITDAGREALDELDETT